MSFYKKNSLHTILLSPYSTVELAAELTASPGGCFGKLCIAAVGGSSAATMIEYSVKPQRQGRSGDQMTWGLIRR